MLEILDILFPDTRDPSISLMSPVGLSMLSAGALGDDGDVNVYESGDAWMLISRKGTVILN